jgi:hypothetical protein
VHTRDFVGSFSHRDEALEEGPEPEDAVRMSPMGAGGGETKGWEAR